MATLKFFLLDIDTKTEGTAAIIRMFGRTKEGKGVIVQDSDFLPYFYAVPKEGKTPSFDGLGFVKIEEVKKEFLGKPLHAFKLFLRHPKEVPEKREAVAKLSGVASVLEADILFVRRYVIDKGLAPLKEVIAEGEWNDEVFNVTKIGPADEELKILRLLAFDIEVFSTTGAPQPAKDPIILISYKTQKKEGVISLKDGQPKPSYVEVVDSEKALIERFAQVVKETEPDALVGYNIDAFDLPYLRDRAAKVGAKLQLSIDNSAISFQKHGKFTIPKIFGPLILDIYPLIRNILSKGMKTETLDLDSVSQEILGTGKTGLTYEELNERWANGILKDVFEYSLRDSQLAFELGERLLPNVYALAKTIRTPLQDTLRMTSGQIVEWFLIQAAHGRDLLSPNRPPYGEIEERISKTFEGAYVKEPLKGLHDNVVVCDYRSLYPSIIIGHNVDPGTLNCECCEANEAPTGDHFCKKKHGFIPTVLAEIFDQRIAVKKKMRGLSKNSLEYRVLDAEQFSLKLILNSHYGYLGYFGARWYCLPCAKAITAWGRHYIQQTIALAEAEGFKVIYGDTDSCFLAMDTPNLRAKVGEFIGKVNKTLPEEMELELQDIYKRGIFITKKRYAMRDEHGEIVVKGLERVRRDWAPIAKDTQEAVLRSILDKGNATEAVKMVQVAIENLKKKKVKKDDVTILTQLTKDPSEYKITSPHVEAAKRMEANGKKVRSGMLMRFIVVRGGGSISSRSLPAEDVKEGEYDADYYINHQLLPAVTRILDALNVSTGEFGKDQTALSKFY